MTSIIRHVLAFVRQSLVGVRFGLVAPVEVGEDVFEEVWEEVQRLLLGVLARWQALEDDGGDNWTRVRMAEGLRARPFLKMADRDVVAMHDEVVKRLRRKQYKDGWKIQVKLRVLPEVWTVLQPEFVAAGARLAEQGDKVVVKFLSPAVVSRVFYKDRLVSGGSKFVVKHGVFVKCLSPPAQYPCSVVAVGDVRPLCLAFSASKCELTVQCHWEHFDIYGNLIV